jgi:hypothetical protein
MSIEYIEIIMKNNKIVIGYQYNKNEIRKLLTILGHDISIILDLHNVIDMYDINDKFLDDDIREKYKICALSYVGRNKMRDSAREELKRRIDIGQIDMGIMIFERGYNKVKDIFVSYGSKAWTIKYLHTAKYKRQLFVDDGLDHINSVTNMLSLLSAKKINLSVKHIVDPKTIDLPLILNNWIRFTSN